MIPLSKIRAHIRQDETYDDALLSGYLAVAIEIAEAYIGTPLKPNRLEGALTSLNGRIVTEHAGRNVRVTDGAGRPVPVRQTGRRTFEVNGGQCVAGRGRIADEEFIVAYDVGSETLDPIIEMGILRLIAHLYEHRGDETNDSGQVGQNAALTTSGAVQFFNMRKSIAF